MELNKKTMRNLFLLVFGGILLYWILHETDRVKRFLGYGLDVLTPFIAGAAVAFVLNVPMRAIERLLKKVKQQGLRRALAILITFVVVIAVLVGVFYLLVPQLIVTGERLIDSIPGFIRRVQQQITEFLSKNPEIQSWVTENTNFANLNWSDLIQKIVTRVTNGLYAAADGLILMVKGLSTGIFNAVLSLVFGVYCLGRKEILARQARRILYSMLPEKVCDEIIRILRLSNSTFSNFISGQCLEALILGCMFAISMLIFRMPYIPLVSVIIAVTALVPIVGAFVGCIIGAFFILVESPVLAFWFVIMFLVLQQIEGNLIYPRVVGTSIGLPGMWVLLAVAVGGDLMGVGGMLLMIPFTAVLYALTKEFTEKRLAVRNIPAEKLQEQPPELKSGFKQSYDNKKEQRKQKPPKKKAKEKKKA